MSLVGHELPRHLAERAAVMPPKAAAPSRDQGGRGGPTSDINHAAAMARGDSDPVGCRGRFKLPIYEPLEGWLRQEAESQIADPISAFAVPVRG